MKQSLGVAIFNSLSFKKFCYLLLGIFVFELFTQNQAFSCAEKQTAAADACTPAGTAGRAVLSSAQSFSQVHSSFMTELNELKAKAQKLREEIREAKDSTFQTYKNIREAEHQIRTTEAEVKKVDESFKSLLGVMDKDLCALKRATDDMNIANIKDHSVSIPEHYTKKEALDKTTSEQKNIASRVPSLDGIHSLKAQLQFDKDSQRWLEREQPNCNYAMAQCRNCGCGNPGISSAANDSQAAKEALPIGKSTEATDRQAELEYEKIKMIIKDLQTQAAAAQKDVEVAVEKAALTATSAKFTKNYASTIYQSYKEKGEKLVLYGKQVVAEGCKNGLVTEAGRKLQNLFASDEDAKKREAAAARLDLQMAADKEADIQRKLTDPTGVPPTDGPKFVAVNQSPESVKELKAAMEELKTWGALPDAAGGTSPDLATGGAIKPAEISAPPPEKKGWFASITGGISDSARSASDYLFGTQERTSISSPLPMAAPELPRIEPPTPAILDVPVPAPSEATAAPAPASAPPVAAAAVVPPQAPASAPATAPAPSSAPSSAPASSPAAGPKGAASSGGPTGASADSGQKGTPETKKSADLGSALSGLANMANNQQPKAPVDPPKPPEITQCSGEDCCRENRDSEQCLKQTKATQVNKGGDVPEGAAPSNSLGSVIDKGLASLASLLTGKKSASQSSALAGDSGGAGSVNLQAGMGGAGKGAVKKNARIAATKDAPQVNGGFAGAGPAGGKGSGQTFAKKGSAKNQKIRNIASVDRPGDAPMGRIPWERFLPQWVNGRKVDRRIAVASGHPEFAGAMTDIFQNMNRAYSKVGYTLIQQRGSIRTARLNP